MLPLLQTDSNSDHRNRPDSYPLADLSLTDLNVLVCKSIEMLYQEEIKHIALFDRYASILRDRHPEWVPDFEQAFEPYKPALMNPYNWNAYPSGEVQHYFFWLKTLFFEEYTIYLHEVLKEEEIKHQHNGI